MHTQSVPPDRGPRNVAQKQRTGHGWGAAPGGFFDVDADWSVVPVQQAVGLVDRLPVRGAFVAFLCVCTSVPALSWGQYRPVGTNTTEIGGVFLCCFLHRPVSFMYVAANGYALASRACATCPRKQATRIAMPSQLLWHTMAARERSAHGNAGNFEQIMRRR
jgi:hypothetical protein